MIERPSSSDITYRHHHHHHSNRPAIPRHSCLQRQKTRRTLVRQNTSFSLTTHCKTVSDAQVQKHDDNNNVNEAINGNNVNGNNVNGNNVDNGNSVDNANVTSTSNANSPTNNNNAVAVSVLSKQVTGPQHKSKKILLRQHTAFCLPVHKKEDPNNNAVASTDVSADNGNNASDGRRDVSNRVKYFVLKLTQTGFIPSFLHLDYSDPIPGAPFRFKLTKTGFIPSFLHLDYSYAVDKCVDTHSESDELVGDFLNDNIFFEPDITAKIINKEEFELGQVLGAGGFGRVYKGTFRGDQVAIKVMHKFTKNPDAQIASFKAELHVMRFNHPYIVKTLAATHIDQFDDGAWIVMEYVSQRCLLTVINDSEEMIDPERRIRYAIQIASALQYAHKRKVAHLDLKPANILITEDGQCKVGDFGCSQKVEFDTGIVSPTNRSILTGTFAYRAPELLRGEPPTFKADIYSYGVTLWQLLSRETPFSNQNQHVVIFGVCANGLRPRDPEPTETDPFELSYKSLYAQCWDACPLDRPSAQELVELLSLWKDNL